MTGTLTFRILVAIGLSAAVAPSFAQEDRARKTLAADDQRAIDDRMPPRRNPKPDIACLPAPAPNLQR
jgi:hypothetical protein